MTTLKIRIRARRGRPREAAGAYVKWTEYQVVDGRKVIWRCDTFEQAERWIADRSSVESGHVEGRMSDE